MRAVIGLRGRSLEAPLSLTEGDVCLQEKQKISDKLEDTSLRLKDELDLYRKIMDKVWQNRRDFQKEKESTQEVSSRRRSDPHTAGCRSHRVSSLQLVDDLRRELDYLQIFKSEMEHPGKGRGLSEFSAKTMEMEHEVRRLKQVCELQVSTATRENPISEGSSGETVPLCSSGELQAARPKRRPERSDPQSEFVRGQEPVLLQHQGAVPRR